MSRHLYIEKKTTVVTKLRRVRIIEVRESNLRFGRPERSAMEICTQCAGVSMMMTPNSAAKVSAVGVDVIGQLVEAREIHFTQRDSGLLVCLNSLIERHQASRQRG